MDIRYRRVQCTPPEDVKARALATSAASRLGETRAVTTHGLCHGARAEDELTLSH